MSTNDPFKSIAELAIIEVPINKLATAIEMVGFYTWDRFGRYTHVIPADSDAQNKRLLSVVLDALAKGFKGDEIDSDYFDKMRFGPTILNLSGWTESTIPNFDKLGEQWNQQHLGELEVPTKPALAPNFIEPKRKDDWFYCIQHAVTAFLNEHGFYPSEPQLWSYLHSGKPAGWSLNKKDNTLILGESVLDRENFGKRIDRYFDYSSDND
jgi:hypothetical protein